MRRVLVLLGCLAVALSGCASWGVAPVSGKVTLNGKALPNAKVTFQPIGKNGKEVGPASYGETNGSGEYSLSLIGNKGKGAMLGMHRVTITALQGPPPDPADDNPKPRVDLVPERYNKDTELKFEVLPGGTKEADFKLTSHVGGS
jgi:hypothetical protein